MSKNSLPQVLLLLSALALPTPMRAAEPSTGVTQSGFPGTPHVPSATEATAQAIHVSLGGTAFSQRTFGGVGDTLAGMSARVAASWAMTPRLLLGAGLSAQGVTGPLLVPREIVAVGDLELSALWVAWAGPSASMGVRGGAWALAGPEGAGSYARSASPFLDLLGATRAGPVRVLGSAGVLGDRSRGIATGLTLTPGQRAAYGVTDGAQVRWAVAADVAAGTEWLRPYLEYRGAHDFGAAAGDDAHLVGGGLRLLWALDGRVVGFSAGADLALTGRSTGPARPREPTWRGLVQLTLSTAPPPPPPVVVPVTVAPAASTGTLVGTVKSETGAPLADAVVGFGGGPNPQLTDAAGHFRFTEVPPGTVPVEAHKPAYEPDAAQALVVAGATAELTLVLVSEASRRPGVATGDVRSSEGGPVRARLTLKSPQGAQLLDTDKAGHFKVELVPGTWAVTVEAAGFATQNRTLVVKAGELNIFNLVLSR